MSECRACKRELKWAETASGKKHPFDAKKTLVMLEDGTVWNGFVSHFATCPNAAEFSRKGRPDGTA